MATSQDYTVDPAAKSAWVSATVNGHIQPAAGGYAALYRSIQANSLNNLG